MDEPLDVLAFAPHPDDVELACSGSLILASDRGWRVGLADLTEGEKSSRGNPELRLKEKAKATELLGIAGPVERRHTRRPRRYPPRSPSSRHRYHSQDPAPHRDSALLGGPPSRSRPRRQAGAGGLPPFAGIRKYGDGEPHRPEQLAHYMLRLPITPSFIMDVSSVWERRMETVWAYGSQFGTPSGDAGGSLTTPGFLRALEARAVLVRVADSGGLRRAVS